MINLVQDPEQYPVPFEIGSRNLSLVESQTASVTFLETGTKTIKRAFYKTDGDFLLDIDHSDEEFIGYVGDGKKLLYEIIPDSTSVFTSQFSMKSWLDEVASKSANNGEALDLRQTPWDFDDTDISIYVSGGLSKFDAEVVSGTSYYPSLSCDVTYSSDYNTPFAISASTISPGSSINKSVIDTGNYGVLTMLFSLTLKWYFDEDRTLIVSSPPVSLDVFTPVTFVSRLMLVSSGKFVKKGGVSTDGAGIFNGILTQGYVLSESLNYGSFIYVGFDTSTGKLFLGEEDEVIVNDSGYSVRPGKLDQVYYL